MPQTSSSARLSALRNTVLLLAGIIVIIAAAYTAESVLRVKYIRLSGVNKGQSLYGLENTYNQSMIFLRGKTIADLIKNNNPTVREVRVGKKYPDTLTIAVSYYQPAAYLAADSGYLLLSDDGRILSRTKEGGLLDVPVIHYYEKISYTNTQPGSFLSLQDILTAIYFSGKTRDLGYHVITIDIDGVDMIGLNLEGKSVVFSSEKDRQLQVYQMERIVHQFRIEGKNFKKMDFRFNQPVLELTQ